MRVRQVIVRIACVALGLFGVSGCASRGGAESHPAADRAIARTAVIEGDRAAEDERGGPSGQPVSPVDPGDAAEVAPPAEGWALVFPGVRANAALGAVEFDGFVPIAAGGDGGELVYLEVIACAVGSKEHESLVATDVRPSHVHAALLLVGAEPGEPGSWDWDGDVLRSTAPFGEAFDISLSADGGASFAPAASWVVSTSGQRLTEPGWVFAGSVERLVRGAAAYGADYGGLIVGLHTFGDEVIAFSTVMSHDSAIETPEWIANATSVPPYGTPVIVRVSRRD